MRGLTCFCKFHRLVHCSCCRNPIQKKQLIGSEPQNYSDRQGYFVWLYCSLLVDNPIQSSLPAQHSIDKFGDQGTIAGIQIWVFLEINIEENVRKRGTAGHLQQDVHSDGPGRHDSEVSKKWRIAPSTSASGNPVLKQGPYGRQLKIP